MKLIDKTLVTTKSGTPVIGLERIKDPFVWRGSINGVVSCWTEKGRASRAEDTEGVDLDMSGPAWSNPGDIVFAWNDDQERSFIGIFLEVSPEGKFKCVFAEDGECSLEFDNIKKYDPKLFLETFTGHCS